MGVIPGEFRYSIKVQQLTVSKDAFGAAIESYTDLMTLRASKKNTGGSKIVENKEIFSPSTITFVTHWRDSINEKCRIIWNGKIYIILNLSEIGFKEGLQINVELIND